MIWTILFLIFAFCYLSFSSFKKSDTKLTDIRVGKFSLILEDELCYYKIDVIEGAVFTLCFTPLALPIMFVYFGYLGYSLYGGGND